MHDEHKPRYARRWARGGASLFARTGGRKVGGSPSCSGRAWDWPGPRGGTRPGQPAGADDPRGRGVPAGTVTIEPQLAHVQATDRGSSFISTGQSQAWGGQMLFGGQASRRFDASAVPLSLGWWECGVPGGGKFRGWTRPTERSDLVSRFAGVRSFRQRAWVLSAQRGDRLIH
jgi:hypothetical protein